MNGMFNLYIPFCSLILSLFLISLFLTKVKSYRNSENRFYFVMIIDVFVMTITCMVAIYSIYKGYSDSFLVSLANRLECFAIFNYVISLYMYIATCCDANLNHNYKIYITTNIIAFMLIMFLPISLNINQELTYMVVGGAAVNLTVLLAAIFLVLTFVLAIKNYGLLKEKIIPVILLTVLLTFIMIIRQSIPEFICMEFLINFATLIMYHTIENPDLQIIEEYREVKEIAQKQNIDKVMFLHNITQSFKYPLIEIEQNCQYIENEKDIDLIKECNNDTKFRLGKMLNNLTKVYDPNGINLSEIKPFNKNYDIKSYDNICKSLKNMTPKSIDFSYNIDTNLPQFLYGDILNIKEIIKKVYKELLQNINEGYIKVSINGIIDDNICRLIINIKDNGKGYSYEEIGKSLNDGFYKEINDDLNKVDGVFIINSEKGKKSERIIVIDQFIVLKETKKLERFEHHSNKKKVMIVDNSEESNKIIKVLKKYSVEFVKVEYGVDCLNNIRDYNKYDLLIINESIEPLSGIETFNKLKENITFKTPVIILSKKKDFKIKELYLKLGIADIVSFPVNIEELNKTIRKYIK